MLRFCLAAFLACAAAAPLAAAPPAAAATPFNPQIDYASFRQLAIEVEPYRRSRLLDWSAFAAAAAEPGVLILDARSAAQFAEGHIEGAVNLPLPEFSEEALAEILGPQDRPILIYCNNNFRNDVRPVMLKSGRVALNISTFIHLVAYGYRNVRELNDVVDLDDPAIRWVRGPAVPSTG
ncbi:MAG TPA: rhodanese-like domain-containing protein [Allosphingosinicella sp.]|nr:rhodanese-like domain-containing protein [Allosphingosinicella sp.]